MSDTLRLNIGAGDYPLEGFEDVDRKNGKQAYPLAYEDESVDEIRASHVLEHFPAGEVVDVLSNWVSKLKPGGKISIAVPDIEFIARMVLDGKRENKRMAYGYMYGGQSDDNDFHHTAFDAGNLRATMRHVGLRQIKSWKSDLGDCASLQVSLNLQGIRPHEHKLPKIEGVMSCPRLAFTENMFSAIGVLPTRDIDITKHTGAWWHHCLDRVTTKFLDGGHNGWMLVLDYDTVFDGEILDELLYLMADNPHADAIAPWQVKRESDFSLVWITDDEGNKLEEIPIVDMEKELLPVDTAHFGLTLLRTEALRKLKRPWFKDTPDKDGQYGDGRTDPDIFFWNNWKECGNTLFMANHVSIGHCQQMVSWPDYYLKPIHQYLPDYQKTGPPKGARQ